MRLTAVLAAAVLATACAGPGGHGSPVAPQSIARIDVTVDTVSLTVGRSAQLAVVARDGAGAPVAGAPIEYVVTNDAVASISTGGAITARRLGRATVRVSTGTISVEVPLVVGFDEASFHRSPLDGGPYGVGVGGGGFVVTQQIAGRASIIDLGGATLGDAIVVGLVPTDVSVNAAGTEAYVTNQYSGTLGVVDLVSRRQVATVTIDADPYRSVLSRDGKRVWVTTNSGMIYAVDVATRRVVDQLPGHHPSNGFAIAPGDTIAYATNYNGEVLEYDLRSRSVLRTLSTDHRTRLQDIVVSADGREIYVADEGGSIAVFDLASGAITARIDLGPVFGMTLGPDGETLFIARTRAGTVAAIDRTTRKTVFEAVVGGAPRRVAFDATGSVIIVANESGWVDLLR